MHWTAGFRCVSILDVTGPTPVMCVVRRLRYALGRNNCFRHMGVRRNSGNCAALLVGVVWAQNLPRLALPPMPSVLWRLGRGSAMAALQGRRDKECTVLR